MKIIKYVLITLVSLLTLNLLTFYLFGKKALTDRNVSQMIKTDVENWYDLELAYNIISNLELDSSIELKGVIYPVFSIDEYLGSDFDNYINTTHEKIKFIIDSQTADSILNVNLDSLYLANFDNDFGYSTKVNSFLFNEPGFIAYALSKSEAPFPLDSSIGGWCEYRRQDISSGLLRCLIVTNTIILLSEDIKTYSIMFAEQELRAFTNESDFQFFRDEKVIWFFFKWIQIEWIDGNGLGDDLSSWEKEIEKFLPS